MTDTSERPHRRHRPYERNKVKASAQAAIAFEDAIHDDEQPFDPAIPGEAVGGGDPGVALLLARQQDVESMFA